MVHKQWKKLRDVPREIFWMGFIPERCSPCEELKGDCTETIGDGKQALECLNKWWATKTHAKERRE